MTDNGPQSATTSDPSAQPLAQVAQNARNANGAEHAQDTQPDAPQAAPSAPSANEKTDPKLALDTAKSKRESSNAASPQTPTKVKRRKGFWSTFVAACVPCSSANGAHDTEPDRAGAKDKLRNASEASSLDPDLLKKKENHRRSTPHPLDASISTTLDAATTTNGNGVVDEKDRAADKLHDDESAQRVDGDEDDAMDEDSDIVVPPHHVQHHTLPESETGGVTAGAVQAPGQTGALISSRNGNSSPLGLPALPRHAGPSSSRLFPHSMPFDAFLPVSVPSPRYTEC
ncbi:hypothetical protein EXIGLDRAFT_36826 [Exidia glandulosa HHB12029]|uniref:Uncharacterized protein n=1 Tax=Exidia glandulosa HHB12029 TaxID=1314781 RepID=A0A165IPJ7_EXIGL|nr:hypothetical protein EXIGLDRAFT_36826 [Exidia glandulosa HHB12029]